MDRNLLNRAREVKRNQTSAFAGGVRPDDPIGAAPFRRPTLAVIDHLSPVNGETPKDLLRSIVALSRRWTSAGVKGKGIRLEGHELDLLNAIGLGDVLMSAAAAEQKKQAIERRTLRSLTSPAPQLLAPAVAVAPTQPDRDMRYWATSDEQQERELGTVDQPMPPLAAVDRRGDSLLRIPEVRRRTGLSTATIYRRGNERTFPPKVRLGPACVAWYLSDIEVFVADPAGYRVDNQN